MNETKSLVYIYLDLLPQNLIKKERKYKPAEGMNKRREHSISSSQQGSHIKFGILLKTSIDWFCQYK